MKEAPTVRVREVDVRSRPVRTRMEFRYGKASLTSCPITHVRLTAEVAGKTVTGVSAACLPPLWFDKDPSKTHDDNIRDLLRSLKLAIGVYVATEPSHALGLHAAAEPEARKKCFAEEMNDLTAGFGVALLDAAVVDAVCRRTGLTFHQGLRDSLFGTDFSADLPERPLSQIALRHTVGMADPIVEADLTDRIGDGLPETLEEVIRDYGIRTFKVKISRDRDASLDRLRRIASVLDRDAGEYKVTLDGNEQFSSMEEAAGFSRAAAADGALKSFWHRILWIEQPVDRAAPLQKPDLLKPVIIDESDGSDEAVDRALELGYGGISAKNCKGIFRTLHSHRRVRQAGAILSSEDLMNVPIVPLHQDLCVAAALGITHSERNGHHYVRGFEFLSPREREEALREFPSLYEAKRKGPPGLRIVDGQISLEEINGHGLGVRSEPDWNSMTVCLP